MAKETVMKPTQITSALTILTPAGAAVVSLTTTQTTTSTSSTTCALSGSEVLIRTLREVAQQNAQLRQQLSKVFATAVKPLLDVHRTVAQKALGSNSGPALGASSCSASCPSSGPAKGPSSGTAKGPHSASARTRLLPQATQFSKAGTTKDNSCAANATQNESLEPVRMFEEERDVLGNAQQCVEQRSTRLSLVMKIKPGKGGVSSVSIAP